jgi:RNA polymerase sigma-70 factor, ECF subfamily
MFPKVVVAVNGHSSRGALSSIGKTPRPSRSETPLELASVYRAYAPLVAKFALRLGSPTFDAEDIVHDVFLVVQRRLPAFREREATLTTWLYRITRNVVLEKRRNQRARRRLVGSAEQMAKRVARPLASSQHEAVDAVSSVLEGLPEKYRTPLILFEIEGRSGEEIARITGERLATIWVRLHRGRAMMLERARELGLRSAR